MSAQARSESRDPKVIPIDRYLRREAAAREPRPDPKVIPIRPELAEPLFPRPDRRRTPRHHVWLAGLLWVAIALL